MKIFPHRYYCSHNFGWADCPRLSKAVWHRIRPKGKSWYATDMEILDENSIKLYVYDIADNYSGGIGERIHEEVVTEFTAEERAVLDEYVLELKTDAAATELGKRKAAEHIRQILEVRKELFGV